MSDSTSESTPDALPEAPRVTPDAMARILEPRVRSNAKNNPRAAKNAAPKIPEEAQILTRIEAPDPAETPAAGEIEVPLEDVPGFQPPLDTAVPALDGAAADPDPTLPTALRAEPPRAGAVISAPAKASRIAPPTQAAPPATLALPTLALPTLALPTLALPDAQAAPNLSEVRDLLLALQEEQQKRDRAFDLLHDELSGYKNDFYLERLKPTLRALLFLLDSIEGFERELDEFDARAEPPSGEIVRANLIHFRDQLTDVLTLSEMTPIEPASDKFDPKTQRAIEVINVEPEQNNTVQRQVRGGWRLGGKMLRAADVVVGRS